MVPGIVQFAVRHDRPLSPVRGHRAAGGATPLNDAVMIVNHQYESGFLSVIPVNRLAWVEPGFSTSTSHGRHGARLHFAPDPSSQQSCSIGGNVANNSGARTACRTGSPTATSSAGGRAARRSDRPSRRRGSRADGYDLRGAFVGSEGMCGIATKVCVRLTQNPPAVRTMLMDFDSVEDGARPSARSSPPDGARSVGDDGSAVHPRVEEYIHAGLPVDAAAILLVEVAGLPHGVEADVQRIVDIGTAHGAGTVRIAKDEASGVAVEGPQERLRRDRPHQAELLPARHRGAARRFPRSAQVYEIVERHELLVMNVFHAGDGNLHPLLVFDKREPG
jgi:FAD/FMN-containing dehydrogenase